MILLTVSVLAGHPDWGLFTVTSWTVLTSVFLLIRLLLAVNARLADGAVRSWLLDIDQNNSQQPLAVKLFTHRADD